MKYQSGRQGRIIVAKFDDGDNILNGIREIIIKESIRSGIFFLVGGIKKGRFVVGPQKDSFPPDPMWEELKESHETFGTGTVFWEKDKPKIHFHGTFAKGDKTRAGCLREDAHTFLITEAVIFEIEGVNAVRKMDFETGLSLLDFH